MRRFIGYALTVISLALVPAPTDTFADPCGMVPPVYVGEQIPLTRIGVQKTYVFYKDGLQTMVLRPGFSGKVDEFGMLIPFPTPPAIRKVPDNVFEQIAAAIDPPEIEIDLTPVMVFGGFGGFGGGGLGGGGGGADAQAGLSVLLPHQVRVLREEAVGMYEVAVIEAGSADALKRWMDAHKYVYPRGMDAVCEEYVESRWCFVAVKTKVKQKDPADPKPGQREINNELPDGASFDGFVQAMGFRFRSNDFVVPMRLSAFNPGELRNVVYILADEPARIRKIPEEYVMRQVSADQLYKNLTEPLPLRVIGGKPSDIPRNRLKAIEKDRDPRPHNGVAAELFAADLVAAATGDLLSEHEQIEKRLQQISERLDLRGPEIDGQITARSENERSYVVYRALKGMRKMTLTVVDGDFPRETIADDNLTFAQYFIPRRKNTRAQYDANTMSPGLNRGGILILGELQLPAEPTTQIAADIPDGPRLRSQQRTTPWTWFYVSIGVLIIGLLFFHRVRPNTRRD